METLVKENLSQTRHLNKPVSKKTVNTLFQSNIIMSIEWQQVRVHARIQRGDRGSGTHPLKNHKNTGFSSNTGPDSLKNHEATKPSFNVKSSTKKIYYQNWTPLTKLTWSNTLPIRKIGELLLKKKSCSMLANTNILKVLIKRLTTTSSPLFHKNDFRACTFIFLDLYKNDLRKFY